MANQTCARGGCNCAVQGNQKFCSDECRTASPEMHAQGCSCGHADCKPAPSTTT